MPTTLHIRPEAKHPTYRYYRDGFAGAFLECLQWLHKPHAWWGWIIAGPLYPFTAHIVMYYQLKGKWPQQ